MLMDEAKVTNNNDFRRKDTITNTARRIALPVQAADAYVP